MLSSQSSVTIKVLIVERSRVFQRLLGEIFEKFGCEISIASNVKETLLLIQEKQYHLLCIQSELDDGTGYDLAKICREQQLIKEVVPIILISSDEVTHELLNKALCVGITEVLSKYSVDILYQKLGHFVTQQMSKHAAEGCLLYIEDDMDVAIYIKEMLENLGFEVIHIPGPQEAFDILEHNHIDLILTDVIVNGDESILSFIQRVRASKDIISSIPIVLLTGIDDMARRVEFYRNGINDYFIKPIIEIELFTRINNLIINRHLTMMVNNQGSDLYNLNVRDPLTQCYTRDYLYKKAEHYLKDAFIKKVDVGLIFFDIDHFKLIAQEIGVAESDKILSEIGLNLRHNCKYSEVLSRTGQDEFLLMTDLCKSEEELVHRINKLRECISKSQYNRIPISATFCIQIVKAEGLNDLKYILKNFEQLIKEVQRKHGYGSVTSIKVMC